MIGAFARKLAPRDRVMSLDAVASEPHDAPPEKFVERISHEGGDVFVSPVLETLRAVLRSKVRKDDGVATEAAPAQDVTVRPLPDNA